MKNTYIVKFTTISGKTYFLRHIKPCCIDTDIKKAYPFTNKKIASEQAQYFKKYVLSEKSTHEIIKQI